MVTLDEHEHRTRRFLQPADSTTDIFENDELTASLIEAYSTKWLTIERLKQVEQDTGLHYKKGRFTNKERKVIESCLQEFLTEENPEITNNNNSLNRQEDLETSSRTLLVHLLFEDLGRRGRVSDLYFRISRALGGQRPVLMVYHYIRRLLHPGNNAGQWIPAQDALLRRLFVIHGPKWMEIGRHLDRFGTACRDRYRKIRQEYQKGKWTEEELRLLTEAVTMRQRHREGTDVTTNNATDNQPVNTSNLTWYFVSEHVKTRSWVQCLTKWTSLSFKQGHGMNRLPSWTRTQDLLLCHRLYDLGVEDESEIDWQHLLDDNEEFGREDDDESINRRATATTALDRRFFNTTRLKARWKMLKRRIMGERTLDMDIILEALINTLSVVNPANALLEGVSDDDV